MIAALFGQIIHKTPTQTLIDVGGVGYEVEISMNTYTALPSVGEKVRIFTHLQVREDAHILFGFFDETERMAFRQLIKVNGLGPKTALSVLSTFTTAQLASAIQNRDSLMLTRVPGVGGKTAERLIIELKDKFASAITDRPNTNSTYTQINEALRSLGYKDTEVQKALRELPDNVGVEDGIRLVLKSFTKK